ncbi:MFS transporter [uncultured Microbacterium sp.]|uniref:MFS transporter n=1 Tax=uncultured Microbacterium sp. TaxID=191216 RepID=UPI0026252D77|nr:MFS transporter [uncultured Microbacterium sp.]
MSEPSLIRHTGWGYFPIAALARLPFAMMVVGVLTLVTSATGSIALAGLTSAATGVGVVVAGPLIGDLVDRFGQRAVVLPVGLANGILLALFPFVVMAGLPGGVILVAAVLVGLTAPQAAALSRTRLVGLTRDRVSDERRERTMSRVMSYESAVDETAFIIGPVLVGVLASFVAPWAPIAMAALLSFAFVTAFAVHPTATMTTTDAEATRAPIRAVLSAPILVVVGATFGVGLFFGATLTSLTAFAQSVGHGEQSGLLYGLMGIGSAVLALLVMLLPARFPLTLRWLVFSGILVFAAWGYATAGDLGTVIVMLCLMGLGVGPTLVTLFSLAGDRSPEGRSATTMTLVGSALTLAQAIASAVTGALAEATSASVAMLLPVGAALLVLALGVVNAVASRRALASLATV